MKAKKILEKLMSLVTTQDSRKREVLEMYFTAVMQLTFAELKNLPVNEIIEFKKCVNVARILIYMTLDTSEMAEMKTILEGLTPEDFKEAGLVSFQP